MVTRKLQLKQRYDETAKIYDKRYEEIQHAKYRLVLENLPSKIKRLLDLGCGTGMFLNELSSRSEFVVGLDVSSEMLEVAKGRAGRAHLVLADADALPFIDGS
ncbi:MAG: malonyl-[acyl-carrier protein] O-methyltransferase BioC, partial [Hadesarchaea archaeon]